MAHQRDRLAIGREPLDGAGEGIDAAGEEDDLVRREALDVLAREFQIALYLRPHVEWAEFENVGVIRHKTEQVSEGGGNGC